jgi:hypothetical protein
MARHEARGITDDIPGASDPIAGVAAAKPPGGVLLAIILSGAAVVVMTTIVVWNSSGTWGIYALAFLPIAGAILGHRFAWGPALPAHKAWAVTLGAIVVAVCLLEISHGPLGRIVNEQVDEAQNLQTCRKALIDGRMGMGTTESVNRAMSCRDYISSEAQRKSCNLLAADPTQTVDHPNRDYCRGLGVILKARKETAIDHS